MPRDRRAPGLDWVWVAAGVLCAALAFAAAAAAANSPTFLLDTDESTYITIFEIDPTNGHLTTVGSLDPSLGEVFALAAANDNLLYVVTTGGEVIRVVRTPFSATSLGNIGAN